MNSSFISFYALSIILLIGVVRLTRRLLGTKLH